MNHPIMLSLKLGPFAALAKVSRPEHSWRVRTLYESLSVGYIIADGQANRGEST